jgi:hypothetical protein
MCSRRRWRREHPGQQARRKMSGAAKTVIAPGHLSIHGESARRAASDPISLYPSDVSTTASSWSPRHAADSAEPTRRGSGRLAAAWYGLGSRRVVVVAAGSSTGGAAGASDGDHSTRVAVAAAAAAARTSRRA